MSQLKFFSEPELETEIKPEVHIVASEASSSGNAQESRAKPNPEPPQRSSPPVEGNWRESTLFPHPYTSEIRDQTDGTRISPGEAGRGSERPCCSANHEDWNSLPQSMVPTKRSQRHRQDGATNEDKPTTKRGTRSRLSSLTFASGRTLMSRTHRLRAANEIVSGKLAAGRTPNRSGAGRILTVRHQNPRKTKTDRRGPIARTKTWNGNRITRPGSGS
jgi:hypothetical protein